MTTFAYFAAGGHDYDPDLSNPEGTKQWYNLLRAYRPRPVDPPQCFRDPTTQQCTHFELSGDPSTLRGWIDGRVDPPGDRRILLASGPVSMVLGDTQEVVVGLIGAMGKDNIDGINVLKLTDDVAQDAFNLNFQLPSPVPPPSLRIVELDKKLILDWESDTAQMRKIEQYDSKGYRFETYNIYQLPTAGATLSQAKLLPPFDVTQPRSLAVTTDKFRPRPPLVDGQKYYFAISATVYNPDPALVKKRLESPLLVKIAIPHSPNPGAVYPYIENTAIPGIQNTVGVNDAVVRFVYFDPSRPDGRTYAIPFDTVGGHMQWKLIDLGGQNTPIVDTLIQTSPLNALHRFSDRGFTIEVREPPAGIKGVYQVKYNDEATRDFVFSTPNPQGNYYVIGRVDASGNSSLDTIKGYNISDRDIELRFAAAESSWALISRSPITPATSIWVRVPYTAWQVSKDPSQPDRQVYTVITGTSQDTVWRATELLSRLYNGRPLKTFYPITVNVDSKDTLARYRNDIVTYAKRNLVRAYLWQTTLGDLQPALGVLKVYIADLDEDGVAAPPGTVIRFEKYKLIEIGDLKTVHVDPLQTANYAAAKKEVDKISVFPNPYYGVNRAELSRFRRYVTFNHLPPYAKIRLFNLAGILIRTLVKQDDANAPTQFTIWDLNNETGLPVASGMYLAYLELKDAAGKDLGTKTLKLMIVQEQQFLDNY